MPSTARRSRQTVLPVGSARCSGSWVRRPVMVMLFIAAPCCVVVGVSDKALGGPRAGWRSRAPARGKPAQRASKPKPDVASSARGRPAVRGGCVAADELAQLAVGVPGAQVDPRGLQAPVDQQGGVG